VENKLKNIIEKHKNGVRGIIKSITGSHNEDLEQEVYIRAWKNIKCYEEKGKLAQWMHTIAANISRDYLRSKSFKTQQLQEYDETKVLNIKDRKQTPEDDFTRKQRQKTIVKAINELPAKYKEVVILTDIEDMTYEQIAQKLKCPIGTVKSRLFNARKKLSESLIDLL